MFFRDKVESVPRANLQAHKVAGLCGQQQHQAATLSPDETAMMSSFTFDDILPEMLASFTDIE